MMKTNRQLKAKYEPKAEYLLSGKLFCAKCGCTMKGISGHSGGNGEVYRYCACSNPQCRKRNIPKDDLEGKVIRSICDHLLQPETMELLAETMRLSLPPTRTGSTSTTTLFITPLRWTVPGNFGIFYCPGWQCSG